MLFFFWLTLWYLRRDVVARKEYQTLEEAFVLNHWQEIEKSVPPIEHRLKEDHQDI
jgi:hypothetical protein